MSTSESRKPVDPAAPSQRYLFETSFDAEALAAQEEPTEPTFSTADLEAARQAAHAEGEAAGRQDAVNGIEKQLLNGLGRLVEQMTALSADQARYQDGLTERSVELGLKALRKMFPAIAQRDGLVEIEAVLADCLREARAEPRIVVRVTDALVEPLQERVDTLAAATGHEGTIAVMADPALGPADCRVEWAEGGAERVVQQLWQEFEAATQRIFQSGGADTDADTDIVAPEAAPATTDDATADGPVHDAFDVATEEPPMVPDMPDLGHESPETAADLNGHVNGGTAEIPIPDHPPTDRMTETAEPPAAEIATADPDAEPPTDTQNAS